MRGHTQFSAQGSIQGAHGGDSGKDHQEAPHTEIKEASPTETDALYFMLVWDMAQRCTAQEKRKILKQVAVRLWRK